jgi:hypothetical protein
VTNAPPSPARFFWMMKLVVVALLSSAILNPLPLAPMA